MSAPPIDAQQEMKRGLWWLGGASVAMRLLDVAGTLLLLLSRDRLDADDDCGLALVV